MSDVTNAKPDGNMSTPPEKRDIKVTAKGLAYRIERYQAARKSKCKQASKQTYERSSDAYGIKGKCH